jgi:putative ABC transport system substrate-binding protein
MNRRELMTLLGGAAAAPALLWPSASRAQQAQRIRRVGVLMGAAENDAGGRRQTAAFRESLAKLGWVEGRNIEIDVRWVGADERRRVYAAEMVGLTPDVIVANTAPVAIAVKQETARIPIVFASGSDPVRNGLVSNLAHPGGNVTGFPATEPSLSGKWLALLRELAPGATRIALIEAPENPVLAEYRSAAESAAQGRKLEITAIEARDDVQIARDLDAFAGAGPGALLVLPGASTGVHGDAIVTAAARHRLPAIYPFRNSAVGGGLMSYGADNIDIFRHVAAYVDRILRGEMPGDLPVQLPTGFELVINVNTAKALGLELPASLLALADEVIE